MDLDNKLFFALKEPSNQVTKKLPFREKERKKQTCVWNVLGNGVLLDGLWRDLLQRFGANEESS
jgi:hypothetical protein